jgi:hypothetical protein
MTIDQNYLELMSVQSEGDLTSLTNQLNGTNLNIAKWTDDQTLYQGMMDKSKADLEDRLTNVKLPFWQITYPFAVIEYGSTYNVSTLSDWAIKD